MRCFAAGLREGISVCVSAGAQRVESRKYASEISVSFGNLIHRTMGTKKRNHKSIRAQSSSSTSTEAHSVNNAAHKQVWAQVPQGPKMGLKAVMVGGAEVDSAEKVGSTMTYPFVQARVRATFYPKFENEKSDQEVRTKMIQVVAAKQGVVEVSLKHSGSLFLYSGGPTGGAFAKNSYGNLYTAVGVFVLGRTFKEAWGSKADAKESEFNLFLQKEHLSVAMELVTAVLGDHGQRPLQDYVVVTAVADMKERPTFLSTPDVVAFCHQWRLPTNHVWLFSTKNSVSSFFSAYDALCEEGTATSVTKVLDELCDLTVPGMKSHQELQGEILEGLVARVVDPASMSRMEENLMKYPVPKIDGGVINMGTDLRTLCSSNISSEEQKISTLLQHAGQGLCSNTSDWTTDKTSGADSVQLETFLQASPADAPTQKLQELCGTLRSKKLPVRFKLRANFDGDTASSGGKEPTSFRMTIHVLSDSTFRRYQQEMRENPGLWPLYRGFFVDFHLLSNVETPTSADELKEAVTETSVAQSTSLPASGVEGENLMIKLKFLPYKLRTFLIRNGLPSLLNKGVGQYKTHYKRQMKNWGTSEAKQKELVQLLDEWAVYASKHMSGKNTNDHYLTVAEPFLEKFARRSAKNQRLVGSAGSSVNVDGIVSISGERSDDEDPMTSKGTSSSSTPPSENSVETIKSKRAQGMLVFFPGIPGSGKSVLCEEIRKRSEFGDQQYLMGDVTKGKYWQKIGELRKKKPSAVTLADKNAPNREVWDQIESICENSEAIGVPVIVDSAGTNCNPYSLDALAVFMHRVLQRTQHPGNLDRNCPNPGAVLLMFYNLYHGKDRKEFEEALMNSYGHVVTMPYLKAGRGPLPGPVEDALNRGIDLHRKHVAKHGRMESTKGTLKDAFATWETQLRETLTLHASYLNEIQIPLLDAVKPVVDQLLAIKKSDFLMHEVSSKEVRSFNSFSYVAVKLPQDKLQVALKSISGTNSEVRTYLDGKSWKERLANSHVTLAHKAVHGVAAVAQYGSLRTSPAPVQVTAFLFSEKLCALEVQLGAGDENPIKCLNTWPHVTIWTGNGMKAKDANLLPELARNGEAKRVLFTKPVTIVGSIDFF